MGWNYLYISILQRWKWMSNFMPQFMMDAITYPWWDQSKNHVSKGVAGHCDLFTQSFDVEQIAGLKTSWHGKFFFNMGNHSSHKGPVMLSFEIYLMLAVTNCWTNGRVVGDLRRHSTDVTSSEWLIAAISSTVKPVYNDHLMGYFSAFWSSSRWPLAT